MENLDREKAMQEDIKELFENRLDVSNRLIKIETILENQTKQLDKILEQTLKTNGRVSTLESFRDKLLGKISGIAIVISVIVTVMGMIASFIIKH